MGDRLFFCVQENNACFMKNITNNVAHTIRQSFIIKLILYKCLKAINQSLGAMTQRHNWPQSVLSYNQ